MTSYFEWAANQGRRKTVIELDVIEVPEYLVLEGEAAGDTIRRHLERAQREQLSLAEQPLELLP